MFCSAYNQSVSKIHLNPLLCFKYIKFSVSSHSNYYIAFVFDEHMDSMEKACQSCRACVIYNIYQCAC